MARAAKGSDLYELALLQLVNALPAPVLEADELIREFGDSYDGFIEESLGLSVTPKQREICRSVQENRRTAVRSCHASGKTYIAAAIVIAFLHLHPFSKVITTAPGGTQVKEGMWQYINAFYESSPVRSQLLGRPTAHRWGVAPNWYALGLKPDDSKPGSMQGFHAPNILIVADEAAEIAQPILSSLESLMTGGGARLLYLGNPTDVSGMFYNAFHGESSLFHCLKIEAADTPNIQAGRIVVPGLIDQTYIDEQIALYGKDSDWVQARVYAEFPKNQATAWVPIAHVQAAQGRSFHPVQTDPLYLGLDIARTGDDQNVLAARQGEFVHGSEQWQLNDLMQSVGLVRSRLEALPVELAERYGWDRAPRIACLNIDETGIGAGLVDRLLEIWQDGKIPNVDHIAGVNFAGKSIDPEKWQNVRQELWYGLRERFREGRISGVLGKQFIADVTGAKSEYKSGYSMPQVESKETMRKRIKRSPDEADAHALAFYVPTSLRLALAGTATPLGVAVAPESAPYWAIDDDGFDE